MIRSIQTQLARFALAILGMAGLAASPAASALTAQTITFNAIANQGYGSTLTLSATASSGLPVSFSSTTTGVCTVSGTTVSHIAMGTCTIAANQAGNATYAAAPQKTQSYTVTPGSQSITFAALANKAYGSAPFTLSATASSGLVVAFSSGTNGVCTVSTNPGTLVATVTLVGAGTCSIIANQGGNTRYYSAPPVTQSFTVSSLSQTISFAALAGRTYSTTAFSVSATATSGLAVAFSSSTKGVCTVSGNSVSLTGIGTCTLNANQPGNGGYTAAPQVSQSFIVTQAPQSITFTTVRSVAYGASATLSATASSGMAVNFTSATPNVCTVVGNSVTGVAVGTCTINANEAGTIDTSAAAPVSQSFPVVQAAQTITFTFNGGADIGLPITLSASASSGLPVSFSTSTPTICSVSGNTATGLAAGSCYVLANQAGNTNIGAAPQVKEILAITTPGTSVILTSPVAGTTSGKNLTFSATATHSSGDSIVQVAFYDGNVLLGTATQAPYTLTFPEFEAGTYSFTARATEANSGNVASSAPVVVTVTPQAAGGGSGGTQPAGPQTIYAVYADQLDTPRMITDQAGNVVWQWDNTDPFGNNLPNQDPNETGNQFVFNLRMSHQYTDLETGTNYNYFRDYDSSIGRYIESDPIGLRGGQPSTYGYVGGNPLNSTDTNGLLQVYVWNYQGSRTAWGHASITLDDGTHISWWPSGDRHVDINIPHAPIYSARANKNQTMDRDIRLEGGEPDQVIIINGLDEAAIKKWWEEFQKTQRWKTLTQNCSTTAADALNAGGAALPAWLGGWAGGHPFWTPNDVARYANAINNGLDRMKKPIILTSDDLGSGD